MNVFVDWIEGLRFRAHPPSGYEFVFDGSDDVDEPAGPQPVETMLCAAAACTGMDVISILQKKRQEVKRYRVELVGERPPQGEYPRLVTKIHVRHIVSGENLDPVAVARAVELSDTKYCSILATLRQNIEVTSEWQVY